MINRKILIKIKFPEFNILGILFLYHLANLFPVKKKEGSIDFFHVYRLMTHE